MVQCDKCKENGEDRRVLWMSCLYDMTELDMPLGTTRFQGTVAKKNGEKRVSENIFNNTYSDNKAEISKDFYTLTLCKACRAEWMLAVQKWFNTPRVQEESPRSGIFVRELGYTKEISEEEWYKTRTGEPIRVRQTDGDK